MKVHSIVTISTALVFLAFTSLISCSDTVGTDPTENGNNSIDEIVYHERAFSVYDNIMRYYYVDEQDFLLEHFPKLPGDLPVSTLWPYFGFVGGVNTLIELGYDSQPFIDVVDRLDLYFDDSANNPVYAAYPPEMGPSTHFYDDNAVVGIELINAYQITENSVYLQKAEDIMPFQYTGETARCGGGGLAWNENDIANPENPNAMIGMSSSGYTALLALRLYQITGKEEYLEFGNRIYDWLYNNLRNGSDHIYWNDVKMATDANCEVNKDLYTYNTGVMMQVEIVLYEITGSDNHLQEAKRLANGAYTVFTRLYEGKRFFPARDPWFHGKLLQGYLDLYKYDESAQVFINIFIDNANHAWEHARNDFDLFYEDWTGNNVGRDRWLLNQASVLEVFGLIALHKNEKLD